MNATIESFNLMMDQIEARRINLEEIHLEWIRSHMNTKWRDRDDNHNYGYGFSEGDDEQ